jgi:hypothetical protein
MVNIVADIEKNIILRVSAKKKVIKNFIANYNFIIIAQSNSKCGDIIAIHFIN